MSKGRAGGFRRPSVPCAKSQTLPDFDLAGLEFGSLGHRHREDAVFDAAGDRGGVHQVGQVERRGVVRAGEFAHRATEARGRFALGVGLHRQRAAVDVQVHVALAGAGDLEGDLVSVRRFVGADGRGGEDFGFVVHFKSPFLQGSLRVRDRDAARRGRIGLGQLDLEDAVLERGVRLVGVDAERQFDAAFVGGLRRLGLALFLRGLVGEDERLRLDRELDVRRGLAGQFGLDQHRVLVDEDVDRGEAPLRAAGHGPENAVQTPVRPHQFAQQAPGREIENRVHFVCSFLVVRLPIPKAPFKKQTPCQPVMRRRRPSDGIICPTTAFTLRISVPGRILPCRKSSLAKRNGFC